MTKADMLRILDRVPHGTRFEVWPGTEEPNRAFIVHGRWGIVLMLTTDEVPDDDLEPEEVFP